MMRFIIFIKYATGNDAFDSYIYKTRSVSPSHLHEIWTKRATGSSAFYGPQNFFALAAKFGVYYENTIYKKSRIGH
jgi:hypothetical protein